LLQFKDQLEKRNKAEVGIRYEWFALQRCANTYYDELFKDKIIYPNMTKYLPFIFDDEKFFVNQKCFIMTGKKYLKYLTGFFNCTISSKWIRENCPELQGGTRELSKIFFENIPIPPENGNNKDVIERIEKLVSSIFTTKKKNPQANTSACEKDIDQLVYNLYELTDDEIKIVEGEKTNK